MGFYGCDIEDQDAVLAMVRERISSTSTARINRSKDEGVAGCVFFFFACSGIVHKEFLSHAQRL